MKRARTIIGWAVAIATWLVVTALLWGALAWSINEIRGRHRPVIYSIHVGQSDDGTLLWDGATQYDCTARPAPASQIGRAA